MVKSQGKVIIKICFKVEEKKGYSYSWFSDQQMKSNFKFVGWTKSLCGAEAQWNGIGTTLAELLH